MIMINTVVCLTANTNAISGECFGNKMWSVAESTKFEFAYAGRDPIFLSPKITQGNGDRVRVYDWKIDKNDIKLR